MHYFHVLTSCVLFFSTNEADTFPLTLSITLNIECSSHFFVHFFHLSFVGDVLATVLTKPAVTEIY